jgi:hypothetical protein
MRSGGYAPRAVVKARALIHVVMHLGGLARTTSPGRGMKVRWMAMIPGTQVPVDTLKTR